MALNEASVRKDFSVTEIITTQKPQNCGEEKIVCYVDGERIGEYFETRQEAFNDPRAKEKSKKGGIRGVFTIIGSKAYR